MNQKEIDQLDELLQDLYAGISEDLETGSHHRNNAANEEFAKKFPALRTAIDKLAEWIDKQERNLQ